MRAGILAVLLGIVLALTGVAQAQKTVLPGMQTTPPPKNVLPGNPTTPPPMHNDQTLGSGSQQDNYRGSQQDRGQVPPPAGNARQQFQRCIDLNTLPSRQIDARGMQDCVRTWMPQANFSRFAQCWADPSARVWDCYSRSYN